MIAVCIVLCIIVAVVVIDLKRVLVRRIDDLDRQVKDLKFLLQKNEKRDIVTAPTPAPVTASEPDTAARPAEAETLTVKPPSPPASRSLPTAHAHDVFDAANTPWPARQEPKKKSFFEKHPDIEKFIGENLINKIGIGILVLAIAYFVKYAIDKDWIGPLGRVGVGVLCGGLLIGVAHRLRRSYHAFSSVLVGGGIAVLYFTITLAFQEFQLFSQGVTFALLVVITCFAVALSLLYNREELAVIALVGGLGSPLMVSTGHANYHALFIYLVLLNVGVLVIAYFKLWRIVNAASFGLTVILVAGACFDLPVAAYRPTFWYVTVLYMLFFGINVANAVREGKKFIASDFSILLLNTAAYFGAGLYLIDGMHAGHLRGAFTAALAAANLVLSFILFRTRRADTNILYLLVGITLTFISLTAPIQLHGHRITLFWSAECVLLYWLWMKSGLRIIRYASLLVWVIMLVSLAMDIATIYGKSTATAVMLNKGFITTLFAGMATFALAALQRRDLLHAKMPGWKGITLTGAAAVIILFLGGYDEINAQFSARFPRSGVETIYLSLYLLLFTLSLDVISTSFERLKVGRRPMMALLGLVLLVYLCLERSYARVHEMIVVQHRLASLHFVAHWIAAAVALAVFYRLISAVRAAAVASEKIAAAWIISTGVVTFFSCEIGLLAVHMFYSPGESVRHIIDVYGRTGLPVIWGLASFAMMWLGMRHKLRYLRIASLTLFSVTLLKLFLFDIRDIPPAGKIAAFFCLGVLLLIISFMYQKVKKIITDDEKTADR